MRESTLAAVRELIEFSKLGAESFRDGERKNWDDVHYRNIYGGLASIFEGYAWAFELIVDEEGVR